MLIVYTSIIIIILFVTLPFSMLMPLSPFLGMSSSLLTSLVLFWFLVFCYALHPLYLEELLYLCQNLFFDFPIILFKACKYNDHMYTSSIMT